MGSLHERRKAPSRIQLLWSRTDQYRRTDGFVAGKHEIKYEFAVDSPKAGSGGKCALYVDGQKVAEGRIPKTQPYAFSADEGVDVGVDNETMVSNDYKAGENKFTGKIIKVTIDTQPSNLSATDKKAMEAEEEVTTTIKE